MKLLQNLGQASIALGFGLFATLPTSVSPPAVAQKVDHTPAVLSPQELFRRLSPSVFVVEVLDESGSLVASGSGVAVASDQVITNKHVIDAGAGATFRVTQGSRTWPAAVAYVDPDHDLCLLTVEGLRAPAVSVRLSSVLEVGERVYSIGAPEGLELTISEGLISGLREFEEARLIQTSAAISYGSSGGGLFDARGQLVGITTFFLKEGQNLNFALPGEWVRALASHPPSMAEKNKITTPASDALAWYQLGIQTVDAGNYDEAIRAFRRVISLAPDLGEGWNGLGFTYMQLRQYDKALPAFQEAIRLKPDDATAWNNLGLIYDLLHQYDKAVPAFQEATRLQPNLSEPWYGLSVAHDNLQHYDKAASALQEAIRLKPDDNEAWKRLGTIYDRLHQYDKALSAYQEAIRLKPDQSEAVKGLGFSYYQLQQYDKAISAFLEATRLEPGDNQAWYALGSTYNQLHQYDKAIPAFQEATRLKPDHAKAWYDLGIIYSIQGDRSKVMTVYEKLKTLDQNLADDFFRKAAPP